MTAYTDELKQRLATISKVADSFLKRDLTGKPSEYVEGFFEGALTNIVDIACAPDELIDPCDLFGEERDSKIITGLKEALSLDPDNTMPTVPWNAYAVWEEQHKKQLLELGYDRQRDDEDEDALAAEEEVIF